MNGSPRPLLLALLTILLGVQPAGAEMMYWSDRGSNTIKRANLDGTGVETIVSGLGEARGVDLDLLHGKIYWCDNGADRIQRANLDGTNIETLVSTGLSFPAGIAVDAVGGKMYWADQGNRHLRRANLDGTDVETIVSLASPAQPYFVALDRESNRLYWTDQGARRIQRANLDGTNVENLVTTGLNTPRGIDLDLAAGKMYFSDRGTDKVYRADLNGTNVETLVTIIPPAGVDAAPHGVAVDRTADRLYWLDNGTVKLQRSTLTGGGAIDIFSGGPHLTTPWEIVLDLSSIPGDVNRDRVVDRDDLALLATKLGKPRGADWADGDLNWDGKVSLADLLIVQANLTPPASAATPIPEPAAGLIALALVAMLMGRRRSEAITPKVCKVRSCGRRIPSPTGSTFDVSR